MVATGASLTALTSTCAVTAVADTAPSSSRALTVNASRVPLASVEGVQYALRAPSMTSPSALSAFPLLDR